MKNTDIARAWKDEQYRRSLAPTQQEALPTNPAGSIELHPDLLETILGGETEPTTMPDATAGCCETIYNNCNGQPLTILFFTCSVA